MKHVLRIAFIVLLSAWASALPGTRISFAQDRPPDNATAAQIEDGIEKVQAGKLLDAIEQFQKVQDTAGDELVPVKRGHYAPARLIVQGHLARLGPEGVKLYRQRVDGQAAKRLLEAKKSRDDTELERMVSDMFAATSTEDAILELAQRAFVRGEFDAAERFWRMLLPTHEGDERILRFPSPKTAPAAIQAHLIMIQLFQGARENAQGELKEFREKYPEASGKLAGRTGKYVETLTHLLANPKETTLAPVPERAGWPTFAGEPGRLGNARMRPPYFWPDVPTWKSPLPFLRYAKFSTPPPDSTHPRSLAFYPVISDGRAFIADGARVISVDLMNGTVSGAAWPKGGDDTRLPTREDIRHTLTEHNGILYARFGAAELSAGEAGDAKSFLVAFGDRKGEKEERIALWRLDPPSLDGALTHFEGAPVVHNDRLFVGLWRQSAGDAIAGVACYRLDEPKSAPELAWQKWVGKAGSEPNGETRYRHALVSIAGPNVVYCTDGGAVVSLDALTGKTAWEYRYPQNERPTMPRIRDLSPPLVDGGRIYAAPADTDRLLCLDAVTGELIWDRDGIEVIHLLGIAQNRLIATVAGQVKGIRGFNLRTGADSGANGWTIHDDGGESTFGRGLVTEQAIVWPTRHGLQFLNPADGSPLRSPIRGSFGNLCYADGVLLVTTATEVWGFVSEAKKLDERRKAIENEPKDPKLRENLTQSLIDAGLFVEAEKEAANAGEAKERLLWLLAERIIREGNKNEAKRIYEGLAKGDGSFAAAGAVRIAETVTDPAQRRASWLSVSKRKATIRDHRGIPWPASTYAINRFGQLFVMRGTGGRDGDFREFEAPPSLLARTTETRFDDSTLRILDASALGIVASGEQLTAFPEGNTVATKSVPEAACLSRTRLWIADKAGIVSLWRSSGDILWELRYQASDPIVSSLAHANLPVASGQDGPPDLAPIKVIDGAARFQYDGRYLVEIPSVESEQWVEKIRNGLPSPTTRVEHDESGSIQITQLDHGIELDRIERKKRSWTREPIFVGSSLDDLASVEERFFTASDSMLTAYGWKNGERQWEIPLPAQADTKWKITASPQGLLIHPAEAIMTKTDDFDAIGEFHKAGWQWNKLLQAMGKSYDVWTARELPILLIDPADGRLIQRLNFPATGPAAGVAVTPKGVVVVTGKGCWTLKGK